jgi:FAD/FMN-containing dehydrogenase
MSIEPSACLADLQNTFDTKTLLVGDAIPVRNFRDTSYLPTVRPLAVVRPESAAGIAKAVNICAKHGIAMVPQGGLTGLAGGAHPIEGAVAISFERFTGVEEIDLAAATMTVRAGTPLEVIQKAADDAGFFVALDLGARGSCQIGGNLATNAGGNRVIRYGMAKEMVLGLEYVLPDGTLVSGLNKMLKNNAGYDLKQLFLGSEGTLGLITRAVLRLHPKPGSTHAALLGVDGYENVLRLLAEARRGLGPMLSAFEVMWPDFWYEVTQTVGVRAPLKGQHEFYVLIEMGGLDDEVDGGRFMSWAETLFETGVISDAAISQSLADVQAFWDTRDGCAEFGTFLGPHVAFDIGLPVDQMDAFAIACKTRLEQDVPKAFSVYYGHIADGNLHLIALSKGAKTQPMETISKAVYETVRAFEGTVSAEHGIGILKKSYLGFARSEAELSLMRQLKYALDPHNLLNPGKVFDQEINQ